MQVLHVFCQICPRVRVWHLTSVESFHWWLTCFKRARACVWWRRNTEQVWFLPQLKVAVCYVDRAPWRCSCCWKGGRGRGGADVKHTVNQGRQSSRLLSEPDIPDGCYKLNTKKEKVLRKDFVVSKEHRSSFKFRPQSDKHLQAESSLIKLQSEICKKKCNYMFWGKENIFLVSFLGIWCRSELSWWWKWAQALIHRPDWHMCWPVSPLQPPFPSSLRLSHGLLLQRNRFHLPVKPPGRGRTGTKEQEQEGGIYSPTQTHLLPLLSSQSLSSEQTKTMQRHFSLSVLDIII